MPIDLNAFTVKSAAEFRDDILRGIRNGKIAYGIENPIVAPGTDDYLWATVLANQLAILSNNATIKANSRLPDSAVGVDLDATAAMFGLARRIAGGSTGSIDLVSSVSPVLIATGTQLIDPSGQLYEVAIGGTYGDGYEVEISSIATGAATNLDAGTILRWVSAPTFVAAKVLVSEDGLVGGVDAEDDETLRARLLARLQNSPSAGNWSMVAELAISVSGVQAAFVYPTINGPSTQGVAVVRAPTDTNKNRDVDALVMVEVENILQGNLPEYVDTIITTVENVPCEVIFSLALPASRRAVPAGIGGGWLDGVPFPAAMNTPEDTGLVTAVDSNTVITVKAPSAPVAGITRIAWLNPTTWTVYHATVLDYDGSSSPYELTLDSPLVGIEEGCRISPDAEFIEDYFAAALAGFAALGPGEKLDPALVPGIYPRAYRKPFPSQLYPYALGQKMLALLNDQTNVDDTAYLYRSLSTPGVPTDVNDPPKILVPSHISFTSQ